MAKCSLGNPGTTCKRCKKGKVASRENNIFGLCIPCARAFTVMVNERDDEPAGELLREFGRLISPQIHKMRDHRKNYPSSKNRLTTPPL
jgi:hypothetical protein